MSDPTSRRSAKHAISPDRLALLHTLAFAALRLCTSQLDAFSVRLEQAISTRASDVASEKERELFRSATERLRSHRGTFQRLAADALQRALMQAVLDAADHAAAVHGHGSLDLSLITFAAMERKVIVDNLSQASDRAGAVELTALSHRIASWLDADEFGSAHNPFRSEVFLRAIADAWCTFDPAEQAHRLVLRQMDAAVFLDLLVIWKALNQELVLRSVLPDAERLVADHRRPREPIPPPPADESLRQWLAPEGMLKVIDARAAALVDEVLSRLTAIEALPSRVRQLLPALKQFMLEDVRCFFESTHPLRRLLESVLTASLGCRPDGEDRVIEAIAAGCVRLPMAQVWYEQFADELNALAAREGGIEDDRLRAAIAEALGQENLSQSERRARDDILARIEDGEVDAVIESFLQEHWRRVVVFAYAARDARPDMLEKVLAAMDELIDSVRPRQTAEERTAILQRLPALLALLNAWLNVVKWEGAEREAFFSKLAERHAAAMRGRDVGSSALERRMETIERASEHQLDRRAEEQRAEAFAPWMQEIGRLLPGAWCEFVRNDGGKVNCKLLWISPGGSRFIFTGRQGQLLFTLDRGSLAQGMMAGRVTRLPAGEFITRAIAAALQKLAAA